jgi:hypothetical protein
LALEQSAPPRQQHQQQDGGQPPPQQQRQPLEPDQAESVPNTSPPPPAQPEAGADRGAATLRAAEAAERALAAPPPGAPPPEDSLSVLTQLLADAPGDWNPQGRPDAVGAMVGGAVLLRLEELSAVVGSLASWWAAHGRPQVRAAGFCWIHWVGWGPGCMRS